MVQVYPHSEPQQNELWTQRLVPYKTQEKDTQKLLHKGHPMTKGVLWISFGRSFTVLRFHKPQMKLQQSDLQLSKLNLAKVPNSSDKDKPPVQEMFSLMYPRTGSYEANQHHILLSSAPNARVLHGPSLTAIHWTTLLFSLIFSSTPKHGSSTSQFVPARR